MLTTFWNQSGNLILACYNTIFTSNFYFQEIIQDPIWAKVVFTQDWHPADHVSFHSNWRLHQLDPDWAAAHIARGENVSLFEEIVFAGEPPYPQILWPDHCVQGTKGGHDYLFTNFVSLGRFSFEQC